MLRIKILKTFSLLKCAKFHADIFVSSKHFIAHLLNRYSFLKIACKKWEKSVRGGDVLDGKTVRLSASPFSEIRRTFSTSELYRFL